MKNLNLKTIARLATAVLIFLVAALVMSRLVGDHGAPPPPPQPPHAAGATK